MRIFGHTPRSRLAAVGALAFVLFASLAATAAPRRRRPPHRRPPARVVSTDRRRRDDLDPGPYLRPRETPQAPVAGVQVTVESTTPASLSARRRPTQTAPSTSRSPGPGLARSARLTPSGSTRARSPRTPSLTRPRPGRARRSTSRPRRTRLSPSRSATAWRRRPGKLTQALQLTVGGMVFSALLAMAALGLSMIFGTTGLTNFAHGELITFGAIMAFAFDQLPGHDRPSAAPTSRSSVAVVVAFVGLGGLRLAQRRRPLAPAAPPRHRPDRDDDREHRSVDLPAQHLSSTSPVRRASNYSQYAAVTPWEIGPLLVTPKEVVVFADRDAACCW